MTLRHFLALTLAGVLWTAGHAMAQVSSAALAYQPSDGLVGYQDIKLSERSWYIGYYGVRDNHWLTIKAAWAARAAQLCSAAGFGHFVELRYVGEPVGVAEKHSQWHGEPVQALPVASIFIPIIVPRSGVEPPVRVTPNKLAAMRCINSPDDMVDRARAVSVRDSLEAAKQAGLAVK